MKTLYLNTETPVQLPCVATIGFFDGVHRGHQYLIRQVVETARRDGLVASVITFSRHPRQVLQSAYVPQLLTTTDQKLQLLSHTGADQAVVLDFDAEMASLSARDFMDRVLRSRLSVSRLVIGYDHHFGRGRADGFDDYVRYGHELGIEVVRSDALVADGVQVSSSVVRRCLLQGQIEQATHCLGHPYVLAGHVVGGFRKGRELGFPTANIDISSSGLLVPSPGVYAVRVRIEGSVAARPAMMNIGVRPTFGGTSLSLEVHILDFSDNLYNRQIQVAFVSRIREERRFDSPHQLVEQLREDREAVRARMLPPEELPL